ncbi:histidinol-phosphate transaminase [Aminithiophilus ramosus]|uniref:Histidinol-phosphate aminotransferase n=2 Tax=Synergistales TaxID=649776 RepID=A0A9Q7ALE1_9BACT|nr:histidinol-phosphate transaminase [Aminithiophilus ramosus]QTX33590.1 histidinol-phosphate transaminase [Aminithiophilus ramosus]QVL37445.1 histidinol-phosphate transaminase [Synergistota bacterium]
MAWLDRLTRKSLVDLEAYRPGKPIGEVQRELGLDNVVRLSSNENPWPLPEPVREAVLNAALDVSRYPDPAAYHLKRAIARKWGVSPSEVMVGTGTEGVLYSLFQAIIDEGDEVVFPVPTYSLYRLSATAAGAVCIEVPLGEDLMPNIQGLADSCTTKTKAVVLCNPNNPTGLFVARDDLIKLSNQLESKQTLLIIDEAYAEYVSDPFYLNGVDLFRQLGTVVILRTFSKIYGLAGLRIGYAIAPKPIVDSYAKVRRVFSVTQAGLAAAVVALDQQDYILNIREKTISEREKTTKALKEMGVKVSQTHTNFMLIKIEKSDLICDALLKEGIIVRPGSDFGMSNHIRVTVGLKEENERFVATLRKVLRRLGVR